MSYIDIKEYNKLKKENDELNKIISKKEYDKLKQENHDLKEKLQNYIPRRRVRRAFKLLKEILEQDGIKDDLDNLDDI